MIHPEPPGSVITLPNPSSPRPSLGVKYPVLSLPPGTLAGYGAGVIASLPYLILLEGRGTHYCTHHLSSASNAFSGGFSTLQEICSKVKHHLFAYFDLPRYPQYFVWLNPGEDGYFIIGRSILFGFHSNETRRYLFIYVLFLIRSVYPKGICRLQENKRNQPWSLPRLRQRKRKEILRPHHALCAELGVWVPLNNQK